MSRDPFLYLDDILDACEAISNYIKGVTYDQFANDRMRLDATARNLQIIGEASRKLPDEIRNAIGGVPWRDIIGMRVVVIHGYHRLLPEIIWSTATEMTRPLADAVRKYVNEHGG